MEIRSIGCYVDTGYGVTARTYIIASERHLITWRVSDKFAKRQIVITDRFIDLVMGQTHLPLRNLNPLVSTLWAMVTHGTAHQTEGSDPAVWQRAAALLTAVPDRLLDENKSPVVNIAYTVTLLLSLSLLTAMLLVVNWVALPNYLAGLPAQIQQQTPLLADSLAYPDGLWPIHTPTETDHSRMVYSAGGYTLSGDRNGDAITAVLPEIYHAVAIQVTVTERGTLPPDTTDGVGIIMRWRDTDYTNCAFVIDYAGDWNDTCSFASGSGHSMYIQRGPNATNTLLVIVRGQQQIMYINGHYVGQYFAEFTAPLGQIGLINTESGMTATFTNFTVWSVNAPPNVKYVG